MPSSSPKPNISETKTIAAKDKNANPRIANAAILARFEEKNLISAFISFGGHCSITKRKRQSHKERKNHRWARDQRDTRDLNDAMRGLRAKLAPETKGTRQLEAEPQQCRRALPPSIAGSQANVWRQESHSPQARDRRDRVRQGAPTVKKVERRRERFATSKGQKGQKRQKRRHLRNASRFYWHRRRKGRGSLERSLNNAVAFVPLVPYVPSIVAKRSLNSRSSLDFANSRQSLANPRPTSLFAF